MKNIGLIGLVFALAVVFGGFAVYQATMPEKEKRELVTDNDNAEVGAQFLQVKPDTLPPSADEKEKVIMKRQEAVVDKEETIDAGQVSGVEDAVEGAVVEGTEVVEPEEDSQIEIDQPGVVISMTDLGFFPSSVSVAVGSKVTFVNDGQAMHWPASDPHPDHGGLPGFDAGEGVATGDAYSYIFKKVGTWGFHDHLQPDYKGEIVVE